MEQMPLTDILKDEVKETPVEKVETPKTEAETKELQDYKGTREKHRAKEFEAQGRDPETGQFLPKEDKPKETEDALRQKTEEKAVVKEEPKPEVKEPPKPPVQEFTEKERAFLKGLEEERRKRQAMEKELADLKARAPATTEPPKGFWDDPEAALKKHQQEMAQLATQTRLQTAEVIARSKYADFDEKIAIFTEVLQQTPGLHAQWLASPDPAEYAYKTGKNFKDLREAGDIDALRQRIEKETRIKIEGELKAKAEALEKERASIPPSLSDVRGTTAQVNRPVYTGPTPLDDILK